MNRRRIAAAALAAAAALPLLAEEDAEARLKEEMSRNLDDGPSWRRVGPFLAGGPLAEEEMDSIEETLKRCHEALRKQFLDKDPEHLYAVYLLPDRKSYDAFCEKFMGERSSSKYGFYLPSRRALVMNIGTGSGTLVHEMTHALMEPDFPNSPCWFNEGFASLFEQSTTAGGKIRGLVNWRLPGLQEALADGTAPSWKSLTSHTGREFYAEGSGLRYAAARYLCMYLQEKGRLEAFYEKLRGAVDKDPSGYETLKGMFEKDVEEVEKEWREWVKGLKYD